MHADRNDIRARAIAEWRQSVGRRLTRIICPLYREGIHRPDLVGSGVLVRVADLVFIVTAAHVLEDLGTGPRYVGAADQLLPLPALQFVSPLEDAPVRAVARFDLGCLVFDPITAAQIPSTETLRLSQLDLEDPSTVAPEAQHFFSGFPETRQPRRLNGQSFQSNIYSSICNELSSRDYSSIGLKREQNLLVGFDKDDSYSDFEKVTAPDLFGISGGAIWRLGGTDSATLREPKLTGIAIAWRSKVQPLGVIGTRIRYWCEFAAKTFPEAFRAERRHLARERTI